MVARLTCAIADKTPFAHKLSSGLSMTTRLTGDVVVIDLWDNPNSERDLLDLVRGLISAGHRKFVVNLAELKWLDSAGLGGVAGAYTAAIRHGGGLVVASPQPAIRTLLDQTKVSTIIVVHESEPEAIASFDGRG